MNDLAPAPGERIRVELRAGIVAARVEARIDLAVGIDDVASNRGFSAKTFTDETEALEWLSE